MESRLGEPSGCLKYIINKYKPDNVEYEDVLESEDLIKGCYRSWCYALFKNKELKNIIAFTF
ncbi:hypothetical protein MFLAVUS_008289 [Mucor flavus]|uniref:Uncharacterized protein n=1 Tax=Mucor flavus TaxID=439312 RepID=A0ABP9Z6R8_9FUNG